MSSGAAPSVGLTMPKTDSPRRTDTSAGTPTAPEPQAAWLYYDGDCPFCSAYVRYVRVRDAVGTLTTVNLREGGPGVDEVIARGFDLDEGMVLKLGDRYYHADDCIHMLALLGSRSTLFNRINAMVFRSPRRARVIYPILRAGRNLTLTLLGRRKVRESTA